MYLSHVPPGLVQALDELIRLDLQNCRDSYFWWLIFSSAVVAFGVILEGPEVIYETVGVFRRRFCPRELEQHHHAPDWITLLALLGWVLVALGVAGEGIAEGYVSKADGLIQTFNDILLSDARKEAAFALERAGKNEKEAQGERLARVQIEERVEWRRLSKDKQSILARRLSQFAGQSALIVFQGSDMEADEFAFTIATALHMAHWEINQPYGANFIPGGRPLGNTPPAKLDTGVHVGNSGNPASSRALIRELRKFGFDAIEDHRLDSASGRPSRMMILVDPRPEGPQGEAKLKNNHK